MLEAVQSDRFDLVVEKLKASQRTKDTEVKEAFEVFTKTQSTSYWDFVLRKVKPCIERIIIRGAERTEEKVSAEAEDDITTVKCVLHAFGTYYAVSKVKPAAMLQLLESVQGILTLTSGTPSMQSIKSTIAKLCELWWLNNDEGAEQLISQLLTYLLITSLGIDGHESEIKRLHTLRSGFLLLDFEDQSSAFLRDLIERCFVHPTYLRCKEGHKLLAFLLNINQGLLLELVSSVIRPQIATGNKTVAAAYGKVLYQAWRDAQPDGADAEAAGVDGASAEQSQAIEDAVQNLLNDGVHAAEAKYFKGVRFLLQSFHDVQRSKLDAMLLRVYDPILWRSLRCAHATVRAQAAVMFLDVFPLQHADGRAEDSDKLLQKQFDLLAALLTDTDHQVRAHGALGVCHILKEYWESLPVNTTHTILKFLIDTLSCDASCANVRHAVFVGLGELFQQPLTHTVLKQLLPLLKNSIHDKSEKVRVAFIRILCQIKSIRGMHFYEIVPVDHLLQRLAEDRRCPAVCRALTELLLNSFYPQSDAAASPDAEQLSRCVQFVDRNPQAAEVFYSHLHECVSIGHIAKLTTVLFTFLATAAARADKAGHEGGEEEGEGAEPAAGKRRRAAKVTPVQLSFNVRLGVLRVVLRLLGSVEDQLAVEAPSRELLVKYLTPEHARALLLSCARCEAAQAVHLLPDAFALVALTAQVNALGAKKADKAGQKSSAAELNALVLELYQPAWMAAAESCGRTALSAAVVRMFANAGHQVALVGLLSQSVGAAVGAASSKNKGKKSKESAVGAALPLACALDLLASCSGPAFAEKQTAKALDGLFAHVRILAEEALLHGTAQATDDDVCQAVQCWAARCVELDAAGQKDAENYEQAEARAAEIVQWATVTLVPACESAAEHSALALQLLSVVLAQASDLLYLDIAVDAVCEAMAACLTALHNTLNPLPKEHAAMVLATLARVEGIVGTSAPADTLPMSELKSAISTFSSVTKKSRATRVSEGPAAAKGVAHVDGETGALAAQVWSST